MSEFWYPDFHAVSWTETPEQTASRIACNRLILDSSTLPWYVPWPEGEPILANFKKVIQLDDGSYGKSLADYYGIFLELDDTEPANPIAIFKNLTESIIDIDTEPVEGGTLVRGRFEQVLGVQPLARIALAETVHVTCGPLKGTLYEGLDTQ